MPKFVKRIPFGTIPIPESAIDLVVQAMREKRVSSGKLVRRFEQAFAEVMGVEHAVAVSTGTDADTLAMAVLYDYGAKRGDEVIVPALSFVATGNSVYHAGFTPVFVDIDLNTLAIDDSKIEQAITPRTKAIMPVHLMGKPARMDEIIAIARKHKLLVIEDAAEAHGGMYKGRPLGSIGDLGAYSTYVAHIITTIEGGVVVTNNADYAAILRSLRSHGRACKCESCVMNLSGGYCEKRFADKDLGDIRFIFERVGYSSKMNELEAAIGIANMANYRAIVDTRHRNLMQLIDGIAPYRDMLITISEEKHEKIGPHAFPMIVRKDAPFSRDQLVNHLESNGIDTRSLFQSMPTQCRGFESLGYKLGQFPNAELCGTNGLHIGIHQDITNDDVSYVLEVIGEFIRQKC